MIRKFITVLLIFWTGCACAMMPENGVWWNPNESGTGFNFELQNNRIWMYAYTYEVNGLPVYLYGLADQTGQSTFAGKLMRSQSGACITCAYHPNTQAEVGSVQIVFDSPSTATLTATTTNGTRSTRLQRFAFAVDERSPYKMFGEWSIVIGTAVLPVYFGERIGFGATFTGNDSTLYARGSRTGSSSNVALARQETDGTWSILMDSSTDYYEFFNFRFSGLNTMEGKAWAFLKTDYLSGAGLPFVGFRSGSAVSVITGTGPALQRSQILSAANTTPSAMNNFESVDASKARLSTTPSDDPTALRDAAKARQAVQEMLNP